MIQDERDEERIKRALSVRNLDNVLNYLMIDTTYLTVAETVEKVVEIIDNKALSQLLDK